MNLTNERISARRGGLIAEWQEGPATISGYAPRKLRLALSRSKGGIRNSEPTRVAPFRLPISDFPLRQHLRTITSGSTLGCSAIEVRI